jgi:hypothetical protein
MQVTVLLHLLAALVFAVPISIFGRNVMFNSLPWRFSASLPVFYYLLRRKCKGHFAGACNSMYAEVSTLGSFMAFSLVLKFDWRKD